MFTKLENYFQNTYRSFPRNFWVLMLGVFIDRFGGALVYPFFAIYITQHFGVGMKEVGVLFAIFTVTGMVGSFIGGAMTDRYGRKTMMLFGLVISGMSSLLIIFVDDLRLFYGVGAVIGLLGNVGGPAAQAMIADLLPEDQRPEGYGVFRITFNLSVTFGPLLGGFLADYNFALLFILDAITSAITAFIVYKFLPESKPDVEGEEEQSLTSTMGGYGRVFRDYAFMIFLLVSILMTAVYMQMNTTMPYFMHVVVGFPNSYYGRILAMNAGMVVLLQFWFTWLIKGRPPMLMMTLGMALYTVGFAMYGFGPNIWLFVVAMVIITVGEMIIAPVSQTLVAKFAPEDMRGRYMAIFGFSWALPNLFVPYLVGIVIDDYDPNLVWYAAGMVGTIATLGYFLLHVQARGRLKAEEQAEAALAEAHAQ